MTSQASSESKPLRVACLQMAAVMASPAVGAGPVCVAITATARDRDLVMLPELWPMGFFSFDDYHAKSVEITAEFLAPYARAARESGTWMHLGSVVEREGDRLFNTSLLLDSRGSLVARYRKIHLFGYQSREAALLSPGDEVVVVDTPWGRAGLATCYDLRFPELFRAMVDRGAQIFLVTSAWPEIRLEAWRLLVRTRALENLAMIIATNGTGAVGGTRLAGHSLVAGPDGMTLAEGGAGEEILKAELDISGVKRMRASFPALQDRVGFLNLAPHNRQEAYA